MKFFGRFKNENYSIGDFHSRVTDITIAFIAKRIQIDETYLVQKYIIKDSDTPESIALELYSDETLHWVVLFLNNIVDPLCEWCMDSQKVLLMTERKYTNGSGGIHHFYDTMTNRVCDDVDDSLYRNSTSYPSEIHPVTNLEYELNENDKRREIVVINPAVISKFVTIFEEVVGAS